jgi:hypothetical protein
MEYTQSQIVGAVIAAYIKVYGEAKWDGLTIDQQHTVIMTVIKDMIKVVDKCDKA